MPALIQQSWFTKSETGQLGVATLIGYLLGPPFINLVNKKIDNVSLLKVGMILCCSGYFFCAFNFLGFYWFYFWRLITGFGGSLLMVLAAPTLLPYYKANIKGKISGIIFSGIGIGAAISGILIPFLLKVSIGFTWIFLGIICLIFTLITWKK